MSEIVGSLQLKNWMEHFEKAEKNINLLASKCTNSDFKNNGKVDLESGFQNQCALCVVLLRVFDNYMIYHRKNVS
jgi:hypothetical protein